MDEWKKWNCLGSTCFFNSLVFIAEIKPFFLLCCSFEVNKILNQIPNEAFDFCVLYPLLRIKCWCINFNTILLNFKIKFFNFHEIFSVFFFSLPKVFAKIIISLHPILAKPKLQVSMDNLFVKKLFLVLFLVSFWCPTPLLDIQQVSTGASVLCLGINIVEREMYPFIKSSAVL